MGRLCLLGNLRQRPIRLRGCIYWYFRPSKRKSNHGTLCAYKHYRLGYPTWVQDTSTENLLIGMIFACLTDTRSILDGILAIQTRMHSQCNTSGGLGCYRIGYRWTKYGTVPTYCFLFKNSFRVVRTLHK